MAKKRGRTNGEINNEPAGAPEVVSLISSDDEAGWANPCRPSRKSRRLSEEQDHELMCAAAPGTAGGRGAFRLARARP